MRGVLSSVRGMINGGATHVGVATDHVIESFRNELWPGYKTGEGIEPDLLVAVSPARRGADRLRRAGVADGRVRGRRCAGRGGGEGGARSARDAGASSARPTRTSSQCVRGTRVVQLDRLRRTIRDEAGVVAKFGVSRRVDSRLSCAGRRFVRRLSRTAGMGRQVRGGRARRSSSTSRRSRTTGTWGVNVRRAARCRRTLKRDREQALSVSRPRHAAHRRAGVRFGGSISNGTAPTPAFAAVESAA